MDDAATVWVAEPTEEPSLAADRDEELALVLHALLLHNGLPGRSWPSCCRCHHSVSRRPCIVLPARALSRLGRAGIGTSRQRAIGPRAICCRSQGLLLDDF
jgi:hypothetical protein